MLLYKCKEQQHTNKRKGVIKMAKIKTTNKYINNAWRKVFRCGYCDLQYKIGRASCRERV